MTGQSDRTPLQAAIEAGDLAVLQTLLAETPALSDETLRWGEGGGNGSVPLHYVCDMRFEGALAAEKSLPLIDALLEAGAAIDAPHERHGDTPLIAAASLYAEDIGLRLIEAGADVKARGLFGATALHWAAICGLDGLAEALIGAGAEVGLRDEQYGASPVGWAVQGWLDGPPGLSAEDAAARPRSQPRIAALLVAAGAPEDDLARVADDADWQAAFGTARG